ncbi:formate C-acetyltransferase/glycerol dehydratase family glycyl radical enzyme [Photobacterium sp. SDRW27]|uniref:glycyl radical protein n=1 Tax=Photobacterium obscurum TaxID=2829490 RepID=UPI0022432966|nr:formate C-acetyltransferase/glycerol dehydratase family glycyl radical enzyme [Photobacterium obscurum]MCW8329202.1 formate C-acetyltransferase/glycerol dehydratase family glycyl radical enzyme [Photobacterium obscurum]
MQNGTQNLQKPRERITSLGKIGYDEDSWGVGVSGVVDAPSPFSRVNQLRNWFLDDSPWTIDAQRAVLATKAYQQYADAPQPIKVAHALSNILHNVDLHLVDNQLLVGDCAAPPKSCPIYPEFSYSWLVHELEKQPIRERPNNRYDYDDNTKAALLELADYWQGNTLSDKMLSQMSDDEMKGDFMGIMLYSTSLYHVGGIGHLVPDYQRVLDLGYLGLKQQVQEQLDSLLGCNDADPAITERRNFYRAQLITLDASIHYIKRYAALAREKAEAASGQRRDELLQMAENCDWIAEYPPRTFWQAFQLVHFIWSIIMIESNGHSVSLGRLDQLLLPYFNNDLANGTASREFIQEIIECHAPLNGSFMKLRDWLTTQGNSGRGLGTATITLGGQTSEGEDATNELSGMFLDMVAHTRLVNPWIAVRVHDQSPDWFLQKAVKAMRMGSGEPKMFSDTMITKAMINRGIDPVDALNYVIVGCVEPSVPGKEYGWHDSAYFSIARVFELAINDGYPLGMEHLGRLGPATGNLADFKSFAELQQAYEAQMEYWVELHAQGTDIMDVTHRDMKPLPYLSSLVEGCIEKGMDINEGAAPYNFTGPQATGVGTVADSLAVIKQLVFEEKKVSGAQLLAALKANWNGYEMLYHLVNSDKVHQYGNDNDFADELARYATNVYCSAVENRPNPRGGVYQPGVYTVSANVPFGQVQAATPDGRKAHEPLSDCIGPVHTEINSHDRKGPTAVIRSAGKLDQVRMSNGTLLNLRFTPSSLSGDSGVSNLIALIKTYFEQGMHLQLNVLSRELLEDAYHHPEKYRGLTVRVAGYSAQWSELSDELRRDIMNRTEMSFD